MEGRRGLTIIEVLAVIAIILAISALLMPAMDSWVESSRVDAAVAQIEAGVASGRARAREVGRPVEVRLVAEGGAVAQPKPDGRSEAPLESVFVELASGARVVVAPAADERGGAARESAAGASSAARTGKGEPLAPVTIAVCLPDGTVETSGLSQLLVGARTLDLAVSRWTGSVTAAAHTSSESEQEQCAPEQFPGASVAQGGRS